MKVIKRFFYLFLIAFTFFIAYLLFNTFNYPSRQLEVAPVLPSSIDTKAVLRFQSALRIKTVSPEDPTEFDSTEFNKFSEFLLSTYPLVDSLLEKMVFSNYSYLYKWSGTDPELKPAVIMAHLDVVPVNENDLASWEIPPFSANILNDTIWARGTIDDKVAVIGIMESLEMLIQEGFIPKRTIYISLGHDEEVGGQAGAALIANYLHEQNVEAEFVLDEGGTIVQGMVPGIDEDVALIGVAEKGFVSLKLKVEMEGGHSSMPNNETAITVLSSAINNLNDQPLAGFIEYLGPEMPFLNRIVFANMNIFSSVIIQMYQKSSAGNALVRTTTAATIFQSGIKDNVVPQSAEATVNFRLLPGNSIDELITQVKKRLDDDRIRISKAPFASEPSATSGTETFGYQTLSKTIKQVFPEVLTAPNLLVGATDSRHFEKISKNIYRFLPIYINSNNIKTFHGTNERIASKDFHQAIRFYKQIILNSSDIK